MNNPYDIHSWSTHYRDEALQGARVRHLAHRARVGREQRSGRSRVGLAFRGVLSLLRFAQLSE